MYNLLIVDDEIAEVNGMVYDIEWSDLGFGEVYKAFNGLEALCCMQKYRIDVVIADIHMPEMDGLTMAREMRLQWPYVKVLFLTGHDEFKYAQEAVELGVFSYLVKPVADLELKDAVKRALVEMENEIEKVNFMEEARAQLNQMLPIMQEKFLVSWMIHGRAKPESDFLNGRTFGLKMNLNYPGFPIIVRMDEKPETRDFSEENTRKIALRNLIREVLVKQEEVVCFEDYEENQVALVQAESGIEELLNYAEQMCEVFQKVAGSSLQCTVSVFLGKIVNSLQGFRESYRETLYFMHTRLSWDHGIIMNLQRFNEQHVIVELDSLEAYPQIAMLFETLQKEKILEWIEKVFCQMEKAAVVSFETLLRVYHTIAGTLIACTLKEKVTIDDWAGQEAHFFNSIDHGISLYKLKEQCTKVVCKFIDFMVGKRHGQYNEIVEQVKKELGESFDKAITVSDISAKLYLNSSYLSRLFKKETGLSIMDYMIGLRIEKAKKLLKLADAKVYEVAESVGYESQAHFNRIFKREVGMSPKEYQMKQVKKEQEIKH